MRQPILSTINLDFQFPVGWIRPWSGGGVRPGLLCTRALEEGRTVRAGGGGAAAQGIRAGLRFPLLVDIDRYR